MSVDTGSKLVGQPLKRKEDARLVTGQTNWTDNIQLPGMLYMAVLRSPMAHARIDRLDATPRAAAARRGRGVHRRRARATPASRACGR